MERIDYLRDEETNALLIQDGDFVRGDATYQHIRHILLSEVGENRRAPLLACGLQRFINSPGNLAGKLPGLIKAKLKSDGFKVTTADAVQGVDGVEIKIEAS